MNQETITVQLPTSVLVAALIEKIERQKGVELPAAVLRTDPALPAIGAPYMGGIYAGKTLHDGEPAALVLLPGEETSIAWSAAKEWAAKQGGELPSRIDHLVLFQNLRQEFNKDDWYWSSESHAGDDAWAWFQTFGYGGQYRDLKDTKTRARAVRRVPIE